MIARILQISALVALLLPVAARADVIDRSVAIVNGDAITLSEVNELGDPFFKKITAEVPANQLAETLRQARHQVIEKLIEKKLILQEAKKLNVQVTDQEVESALQRILESNKSTLPQLRKELSSMGMNEKQYREELREQVLSSKLVNHEVRTKIIIPEEQIMQYGGGAGGAEYHILQIGCLWAADAKNASPSQAEAKEKVKKAHKQALAGGDFIELARQYSDLPSAADGGDLGTFKKEEMAPYMLEALAKIKPGEVSPIVESGNGYHFFKIASAQASKSPATAPRDTAKEEIRERLYQQAMEQRYKDWIKGIRDKSYIKIL